MKFLTWSLPFVCTLTLIQATVATAGDVCSYVAVETVKVSSGLDASLIYNRSKYENDKDFLVYRAQKNSEQFAYMKKNESRGTCSGPLSDVCEERKVDFRGDNQTLLVKIFNTTVSDSGQYAVLASFKQLHPDEKTAKCLKVIHVKVEDNSTETRTSPTPQSTRVTSPSSSSAGLTSSGWKTKAITMILAIIAAN